MGTTAIAKKKAPGTAPVEKHFWKTVAKWWPLYVMMLPGIVYLIVYKYVPMLGIVIAFKNYQLKLGIFKSPWVTPWYKYFKEFFSSPANTRVIRNTITISIGKLLAGMFPSLIFALAVSECRNKKFTRVVQTISYLPHFLSWVVVYGICMTMLAENTGVINKFLASVGLKSIPFLTSNSYFQGTLIGSDLWKSVGWSSITYLAAIMGIDQELYDAAEVDGCGRFRQIWYVTLPGIRRIFIVLLVLKLGTILDAGFNQVYVMMNDQVKLSGEIIDTWIYTRGIGKLNYSLSTAVGLLKSVIAAVLVFGTNKLARKWDSAIW
jgi:putative aldouronate transport system permease protein